MRAEQSLVLAIGDDNELISVHHAIRMERGELYVLDIGNPAGIFRNGKLVNALALKTCDVINAGITPECAPLMVDDGWGQLEVWPRWQALM